MTFRILFTSAGGALSPLNIRLMKTTTRYDVSVLATDQRDNAAGRHVADFFEKVPSGTDPEYPERVKQLVEKYSVDLVLPASDEEALALSQNRQLIERAGATLACTSYEMLSVMSNKAKTYEVLASSGITLPQWTYAETSEQMENSSREYYSNLGEFVVKPPQARGNRGTIIVKKDLREPVAFQASRELHMGYSEFMQNHMPSISGPVLIMERLVPPAWDIDVLAREGHVVTAMPRRRLNSAGVPFEGSVLDPTEQLLEIAARITKSIQLCWLYDYDIMMTQSGVPVPLELNPRLSGSIAAAVLAGVPFYDNLIALVKGDETRSDWSITGRTVMPYLDCMLVPD